MELPPPTETAPEAWMSWPPVEHAVSSRTLKRAPTADSLPFQITMEHQSAMSVPWLRRQPRYCRSLMPLPLPRPKRRVPVLSRLRRRRKVARAPSLAPILEE